MITSELAPHCLSKFNKLGETFSIEMQLKLAFFHSTQNCAVLGHIEAAVDHDWRIIITRNKLIFPIRQYSVSATRASFTMASSGHFSIRSRLK